MRRTSLLLTILAAASVFAAASRSVQDGVYSKDQAQRGEATYKRECARCHGEKLLGSEGIPGLAGDEFLTEWDGKSANDLFELMSRSMPSDDPGGLKSAQYADLVAYVFSANEFPAGEKELAQDPAVLKDIRIEGK